MNNNEDGTVVRYYQWVDDNGLYSDQSFLSRLITRPTRIIRSIEQGNRAYKQGKRFGNESLSAGIPKKLIIRSASTDRIKRHSAGDISKALSSTI